MKFCSKCGKPLTDDMNFCSTCGHKVEKDEEKEMIIQTTFNDSIATLNEITDETKVLKSEADEKDKVSGKKEVPKIPENAISRKADELKSNTENVSGNSSIKKRITKISEKLNKNKKKSIFVTLIVALILLVGVIFLLNMRPSFTTVYNDYLDSKYAEVAEDGSYLRIDTNPYDISDYNSKEGLTELETAIDKLKLPSTLKEEMYETRAMDGRQVKDYDGITVSWTYHPDQGLEVLFTKD